jgi:ABC-type nitrate/sulfonate/bicarbonate transport system substrate-binding protein
LRQWLRIAGLDPDGDVRIVVLPPPLVVEHMSEGQIDGFCAGEPWSSAAVLSGDGWVVAASNLLAPRHPEKVLLVRSDVLGRDPEAYSALRGALLDACGFCDQPEKRQEVAEILFGYQVFPVAKQVLANSLVGPFNTGISKLPDAPPFVIFHSGGANAATRERALWCLQAVIETGMLAAEGRARRACLETFCDVHDVSHSGMAV